MSNTFIKYILGGFISYGVKIILTFIATNFFGLWYFYAYIFSLIVVIFINFIINSFYIFSVRDFSIFRMTQYGASILIFNFLDAGLVAVLTDKFLLYYLLSITISTIFIFLVKFIVYKHFIFNFKSKTDVSNDNKNIFSSDAYLKEHEKPYLKGYEKKVVDKYFSAGMKILDLGCGAGRTTKVLYDMGCIVIGVDISNNLIDLAKQKYSNINFRVGDACNLDFPDKSFDIVFFSFNGIDYIHPKSKRLMAIGEINRVLKDGGLFIYSSHNTFNIPRTKMSIKTFFDNLVSFKLFSDYRIEKHPMGDLVTYYGNIVTENKNAKKNGFRLIDLFGVSGFEKNKSRIILNFFSKHLMYIFKKRNDL